MPPDSQFSTRRKGKNEEKTATLANQLAGRADRPKAEQWPTEELLDLAMVAGQQDIESFDARVAGAEDD